MRDGLDAIDDGGQRRPAPVLDLRRGAGLHLHGVLRQELRDDFDVPRIADFDDRRADG